jgi:hypothetical protein
MAFTRKKIFGCRKGKEEKGSHGIAGSCGTINLFLITHVTNKRAVITISPSFPT